MKAGKKLKIFLSNLISSVIIRFFVRKNNQLSDDILIINTEKLGDLVISAEFLYSISKSSNSKRYFLAISRQYKDLFNWNELGMSPIFINKNRYRYNIFYRLGLINRIRNRMFKTVINITQERGMINDELAITSGAGINIAMKDTSLYIPKIFLKKNNSLYDEVFSSSEVNEYIRLQNYLHEKSYSIILNENIFNQSSDYRKFIPGDDYIVMAPMSSEMERSWGMDRYKQLTELFKERIIFLGTKEEFNSLEYIKDGKENITNLAGILNLPQVLAIIRNCRLFIGNDSGLTHLAHIFKKPLIAIIGGGKYEMFFPYKERPDAIFLYNKLDCFGCNWNCIYEEKLCLTGITTETIIKSIEKLNALIMNKNNKTSRLSENLN
jgi:ADP-heptose:LPS heptosyltransferase